MTRERSRRDRPVDPEGASPQGCCPSSCSCGRPVAPRAAPVERRDFLKILAAGAAVAALPGSAGSMAGPFDRPAGGVKHFVPEDKKLSEAWLKGLFERGGPRVCRGKELDTIGMPVGGIGAGHLYLRGDGTLGVWQIFNRHHFSGYGADNYRYRAVEAPVDQGFAVVIASAGTTSAEPLDKAHFPGVEFVGEYPIGTVVYGREGFPLKVTLEAFSPFIPLNAKDSGLPATLFHITIENRSAAAVTAGLKGWLENAVCFHSAPDLHAVRTTRVASGRGRTFLVHGVAKAPEEERPKSRPPILLADFEGKDYGDWKVEGEAFGPGPAAGTLANQQKVSGFEGKGLVNTFFQGDRTQGRLTSPPFAVSRKFINFLVGGGGHAGETCLNLLLDGKVVRTAQGENNERLAWRSWAVQDLEGREVRIEIVDRNSGPWGHINVDQIELADERRGARAGPLEKLEDFGTLCLAAAHEARADRDGASYPAHERRASEFLVAPEPIEPGRRRTYTFAVAWHFPNHRQGRAYARHFKDALEVARYVLENHDRLSGETRRWHDTFYDSTLPHWLLDRLHSTVSNLATGTCEWWGNGRFWAWEGVGCCEGTCTHVWNYAHALARLFPELERAVREMQDLGEALHPDGLIGFRGQRNGSYAADGQAGTILKCYREHQMSAGDSFLKRAWPNIKKALEFSIRRDGNDDGLIEDSQHNTYDINFVGPNTFVGSLYLGALRAAEEMAREVGDLAFAARARAIFEKGSRLSVERLWNGEYFIQLVDLAKHPKHQYADGCLSDQLFGQGWAHHVGLGRIYPREHSLGALRSIWKYNWAPDVGPQNAAYKPDRWFVAPGEAGLFTCTWPKSEHLNEGVLYRDEVWTGIEYQVAGHMVWEGMVTEALAICRAVHDRYDPARHNPYNEIECGDHYARALASWGVFTALAGYRYHGPKGFLAFAPRMAPEDFRAAFTAAEGWGSFCQRRAEGVQTEKIRIAWGKLRVRSLAFSVPAGSRVSKVAVTAAGAPVEARHRVEGSDVTVDFGRDVVLEQGQELEVTIGPEG